MEHKTGGTLQLRGGQLADKFGKTTYRIAKDGAISYPTAHKYITKPETVQTLSGVVLYGILVDGLRLSPEQVADMRLGDVFDIIPHSD